eukprot:Rhum_TRINITY_DN12761_c1_g1::Rhum_TRINITY_DN12761_c1_g1_i1::g.54196::m.54196
MRKGAATAGVRWSRVLNQSQKAEAAPPPRQVPLAARARKVIAKAACDVSGGALPPHLREKEKSGAAAAAASAAGDTDVASGRASQRAERAPENDASVDSPLSRGGQEFTKFLAVRSTLNPTFAGLCKTLRRDDLKAVYEGKGARDAVETAGNVSTIITEQADSLTGLQLSSAIDVLAETGHYGSYTSRGRPERRAVLHLCDNAVALAGRLTMRAVASCVEILCVSGIAPPGAVGAYLDEVVHRVERGTLRDSNSLVRLLGTLATHDYNAPALFKAMEYHFILTIDRLEYKAIPRLVQAYRNSGEPAEELMQHVQEHALACEDPELRARIDFSLANEARHKGPTPMISRGAQQEWLNIPGFQQAERR